MLHFGPQKNPDESCDCQGFKIGISRGVGIALPSVSIMTLAIDQSNGTDASVSIMTLAFANRHDSPTILL